MVESLFIMLGVIHRDGEGPALLKDWLDRIGPDVITLELSHYGMKFRREKGEEYRKRILQTAARLEEEGVSADSEALSVLLSYVSIPYEFDVASGYATDHGIPFYLIDMDFFSYVKLANIEDLVSDENVRTDTFRPRVDQTVTRRRLWQDCTLRRASRQSLTIGRCISGTGIWVQKSQT